MCSSNQSSKRENDLKPDSWPVAGMERKQWQIQSQQTHRAKILVNRPEAAAAITRQKLNKYRLTDADHESAFLYRRAHLSTCVGNMLRTLARAEPLLLVVVNNVPLISCEDRRFAHFIKVALDLREVSCSCIRHLDHSLS